MSTPAKNNNVGTISPNSVLGTGEVLSQEQVEIEQQQFNQEPSDEQKGSSEQELENNQEPQEEPNEQSAPEFKPQEDEDEEDRPMSISMFKDRKNGIEPKEVTKQAAQDPNNQQQQTGKPAARDYSGLEPEEIKIFKNMSNEAYEKLRPIYLEHKQNKNNPPQQQTTTEQLPPSYYNNPEGYKLSPTYQQKAYLKDLADKVKRHWVTQTAKIRRGERFQDLYLDNNNRLVTSEPKDATAEDEARAYELLTEAQMQHAKYSKEHDDYVSSFSHKVKADFGAIEETAKKYFPGFDDPNHPTAAIQKNVIDNLPESMKDHPLATLVKYAAGTITLLNQKLAMLEKQNGIKQDIQQEQAKAPPSRNNFSAGAGSGGGTGIKISDFKRRKAMA